MMARSENGMDWRWNDATDARDAATFAASVVRLSTDYISHGEIQTGLSPDGQRWADNLAELYAADFAEPDDRDMLVGRDAEGTVCAFLVIAWESSARREFAVIEDMAVAPQLRGKGVGSELLALALERIRQRGIEWVFLESGVANEAAHRFFEREGFNTVSHVFARKLGS
ncbi:GNAT family N-acetyltransferase [Aurantiacibacter zhengii]|uniref:GNAT family N-acetyltransferase n=2 Tax=Aurantiacibacter zhengii TaxID=2307003 RepID=A0A418NPX3_9SPHN|nr:GNAT family N-acetyltransferase [Aurantiacibacter zhengii]